MDPTDGLLGTFVTTWSPVNYFGTLFGSTDSLVKDLPQDPLLAGVYSFNGGGYSFHNNISVKPGNTIIAHWTDSIPLIVVNPSRSVRVLNFYAVSSNYGANYWPANSANGSRLMANCACPNFVSISLTLSNSNSGSNSNSNSISISNSNSKSISISNSNSISTSISNTASPNICFHLVGRALKKKLLSSVCNQQLKGILIRAHKSWCCNNIPIGPYSFSWPDKVIDCSQSAIYTHETSTKNDISDRGTKEKFFQECQTLGGNVTCSSIKPASVTLRSRDKVWLTCSGTL